MAKGARVIVVDSSVWAEWFNGVDTPRVERLRHALARYDAGVTPLIVTEVLQGFRRDAEFEMATMVLTRLPTLSLDIDGHVAAARLFRLLRRRGITVHGAIDCIIAQTCISTNAELLTSDRDFVAMAQQTSLRLCAV